MKTVYTYSLTASVVCLLLLPVQGSARHALLLKDEPGTASSPSSRASLKEGDAYFKQFRYKEAVTSYQEAIKTATDKKFYLTRQLARTYKALFDYKNAEHWYAQLMNFPSDLSPQDIYEYAQVLKTMQEYDKAIEVCDLYTKKAGAPSPDVQSFRASCEWAKANLQNVKPFRVYTTNLQTGGIFLGADFYNMGVILSEASNASPDKTGFSDLHYSKMNDTVTFAPIEKLNGRTNGVSNEAQPSITADGKTMYFVRNSTEVMYYNPKKKTNLPVNANGVSLLGIYVSHNVDGEWTTPKRLSFNSNDFSCAYPFIDADGKTLYFASDRPGGAGGFDLYKTTCLHDTAFSEPVSLGKEINSTEDDFAPRLYNNHFYYASRGKGGFGGADIFTCTMTSANTPVNPENMGLPFNSSKDDFCILFKGSEKEGYFASNRDSEHGQDKFYYFKKIYIPDTLRGTITDRITGYPVRDARIDLYELGDRSDSALLVSVLTDPQGHWSMLVDPEKRYRTEVKMNEYDPKQFIVDENGRPGRDKIITAMRNIQMSPVVKKDKIIKIDNIYFDFNKADIRPESYTILNNLLEFLKENPKADIELSAHTDAAGSDSYNIKLSNGRAKSCYDYLVEKGIDPKRIVPKGYGESHLLNNCKDARKCSEAENQINRRVEVKFL